MSIWSHTLVKNEAQWLWFSVGSVIDFVDKVLLWDTGSTDGTKKVIDELIKKFPDKIDFREYGEVTPETFTKARQEMLEATKSDWFIVNDGDEIWWEDSIKKVVDAIGKSRAETESIVVPTINLAGDIFHYQGKSAGMYKFGDRVGHYNLRAVKRSIPGLHSLGIHGVWGWADDKGKMIQDRGSYKFVDAPYLHATNLRRSISDSEVIKRNKKYRYEIGEEFPKDFYFPEVLFRERPNFIESPWITMNNSFRARALVETPLRKLKRKLWQGSPGY